MCRRRRRKWPSVFDDTKVPPFPSFSLQDGTKKRKGGDGIRDAPAPPTDVAIQHSIVVYIYIPLCVFSWKKNKK